MKRLESLKDPDFESLFRDFERHAFRLETLQVYNVDYEKEPFEDFKAGVAKYTHPDQQEWVDGVRESIRAGKTMSRVHIVTEPVSDYVAFEMAWPYQDSTAAGEDVRILAVPEGSWPEGLPTFDYWLFDSEAAWLMQYHEDGSFRAAEYVDDPDEVARLDGYRRIAMENSVPLAEYWTP